MWYSPISTPVTAYTSSRRCNYGGISAHQILLSAYSPIPLSMVLPLWLWGDIRLYLICNILCIIDCHICRDIFGRIDIMYYKLRPPAVTIRGIRLYLVSNIFYIIDCNICCDIFGRIDSMYCRLSYVSGGALPLKTLVLYIYRPRDTM
jgi:hypothetical protein